MEGQYSNSDILSRFIEDKDNSETEKNIENHMVMGFASPIMTFVDNVLDEALGI